MLQIGGPPQRRPALHGDPQVRAVVDQVVGLEGGVQFDLVHDRGDAGLVDDGVEMLGQEVAHPDGTDQAFGTEVDELLPAFHVRAARGAGPVDQVQIDVVEAEFLEALFQGRPGGVAALGFVPQFRGDEDLVARQRGCGYRASHTQLVAVDRSGVDVPVPRFQGVADGGGGLVVGHLPDSQAELGDGLAVVQCDERSACHAPH